MDVDWRVFRAQCDTGTNCWWREARVACDCPTCRATVLSLIQEAYELRVLRRTAVAFARGEPIELEPGLTIVIDDRPRRLPAPEPVPLTITTSTDLVKISLACRAVGCTRQKMRTAIRNGDLDTHHPAVPGKPLVSLTQAQDWARTHVPWSVRKGTA